MENQQVKLRSKKPARKYQWALLFAIYLLHPAHDVYATQYYASMADLQQQANEGIPQAEYDMAVIYNNGEGVRQDKARAVNWYRKAAEHGHAAAQYSLGVSYFYGDGGLPMDEDNKQAIYWYRKAAEQGYGTAQEAIGILYGNGMGVPKDEIQGYAWLSLAIINEVTGAESWRDNIAKNLSSEQLDLAQKTASQYAEQYHSKN